MCQKILSLKQFKQFLSDFQVIKIVHSNNMIKSLQPFLTLIFF